MGEKEEMKDREEEKSNRNGKLVPHKQDINSLQFQRQPTATGV